MLSFLKTSTSKMGHLWDFSMERCRNPALFFFCKTTPTGRIIQTAFCPQSEGQFLSGSDRHSSTLQVAADMTISLSSGTRRCQTRWCSLVRAALCAV